MINAQRTILALSLLLAACSAAASPTPAGPTTPTVTPSAGAPTGTIAPSGTSLASGAAGSPSPNPSSTATPGASISGDLAALLPTEIAGNAMTIEPSSDPARSFMILWNDEQVAQNLLNTLGASSSDIDVVYSYVSGNTVPNRVSVDAYRVAGADGTALRDGMVENYRAYFEQQSPVSVTQETVAGKQVVLLEFPNAPAGQGQYFYSVGDTVFVVSGTPMAWVEDAFMQLP